MVDEPTLDYIAEGLRGLAVGVGELHEDAANARVDHAVERIAASLRQYGQRKPVVANRGQGGRVIAGNGTLRAARSLGWSHIAVVWVDEDAASATGYGIADNRTGDLSRWDVEALGALIEALPEGTFTGFEVGELEELLGGKGGERRDAPARWEEADGLREAWGVEPGQVWRLPSRELPGREPGGGHRLIVGDCTDPAVMRLLMGGWESAGERAVLAVTSPPYGVGKEYETKGVGGWFETIRPAIGQVCRWARLVVWQIGDLYATGTQFIEPTLVYSVNMFRENNFRPIWIRIWEKQGANYGVGPYHLVSNKPVQEYELIAALEEEVTSDERRVTSEEGEYEWVVGFAGRGHRFVRRLSPEDRREWGYSGVWRINTVRANDRHPAMFPVELPERCIKMHSDVGDLVLEPFCGSGTTIVACENLGRRCAAVEREARYVGVALQRYFDAFGIRGVVSEEGSRRGPAGGGVG